LPITPLKASGCDTKQNMPTSRILLTLEASYRLIA
jgi:hypothetical protein